MVAKTRAGKSKSAGKKERPAQKSAGLVLTYANLSTALTDPRLLKQYDEAYVKVREQVGRTFPMLIGGQDRTAAELLEKRTPVNTDVVLGYYQKGTVEDARKAIAAAKGAFPGWSALPWRRRVAMMRKVAAVINKRLFELSASLSMDVGKSRAEALGDVKETANLIDYYCDRVEANQGFDHPMQPEGTSKTRSVMKPYGVWAVVSPFNFPVALRGGPMGGALVMAATAPLTGASVPGSALVSGVESFLSPAESWTQRGIRTALATATGAAGQKVANVAGNMATNARASQQLRSYPGASTVRDETLDNTLKLGYKLPPSAAGKQSMLESVSGQIKTQQGMGDWNQAITDKLIRQEFNDASKFGFRVTPTTPLTSQTMKEIRAAAGKAYERVKEIGPIELVTGKTKAGNKIVTRFNTTEAVDQIKQLRHDGYQQLSQARSTGDPALLKQAKQTLDDATKMEGKLDSALSDAGKKQLLDDLRASRQLIAKTYDVQDAIVDAVGRVDARSLGSLYEAGEKGYGPRLTGRLADVGKAGKAFKESMGMRGFETPRYSALDAAVSGMNISNAVAANSPVGMLTGGIPLLRWCC